MLKNYLSILVRNSTKNIAYVLINILGLGIALAVCIVAYLNYQFDADFDTCHENMEKVFRIEHTQLIEGQERAYAATPVLLGPSITDDIGGIEHMVRINKDLVGTLAKAGENEAYTHTIYTDPDFFDVFTFRMIAGNKESFRDNNSVFITEQLAAGLFGDQDPLGESVKIWDSPYTIAGVLENHPLNSSFHFELVAPIHGFYRDNNVNELKWGNIYGTASTFLLLGDHNRTDAIEKTLQQYIPVVNDVNYHQVDRFYLAPFKDMAHNGRSVNGHPFQPSIHPAAVLPPVIAAICILLIACFNFTNTTISFAGKRLKEIGIRKVVGSQRHQLILQFMGENILFIVLSLIFALFFAQFLIPSYSSMWEFIDLSFSMVKVHELCVFISIVLIATAILSGAYPALYISRFNPLSVIHDKLKFGSGSLFSKSILILQFGIAVTALFTFVSSIQNANYQENFDLGYDGAYLFKVHGDDNSLKVYKDAIQDHTDIESISESILGPFFNNRPLKYKETKIEAKMRFLELGSFKTLGYQLIEGRYFEPATERTDQIGSILVNRKLVDELGIQDPLSQMLLMNDTVPLNIIGVMENVLHEGTLTTEIAPIFYRLADESFKAGALNIRTSPEKRLKVQQYLEEEWDRILPDLPFRGIEGDVYTEVSKHITRRVLVISVFLVIIAVLLSAAGLYSQVSLRIIHRTKEIGIRKVFGASVPGIIRLLNYESLLILCSGSITGLIAGYFINSALMESIWEYFPESTTLTFIIPLIGIFAFSVLIVSGKVYYAATRNPSHSLNYE